MIEDNKLVDLGLIGESWTLSNNRSTGGQIRQRLDRSMSTMEWLEQYGHATYNPIHKETLDHCMLLLDTNPKRNRLKRKLHFDKRWLNHDEVYKVIQEAWNIHILESRIFKAVKKIRACKEELLKWNKTVHIKTTKRTK